MSPVLETINLFLYVYLRISQQSTYKIVPFAEDFFSKKDY